MSPADHAISGPVSLREYPVEYLCGSDRVYGVAHLPESPVKHGLIVIGRTGSDRGSVYLCRDAARAGLPAFRFDFRGRGWCEGPLVPVQETGEDIACAIQALQSVAPGIGVFTIVGMSEGAAAAFLYARSDPRVAGIVAVNPWIRMEQETAKQHVKMNLARVGKREFWKRIRNSESGYIGAARSFVRLVGNVVTAPGDPGALKQHVVDGLMRFEGKTCIILGGADPSTIVFQKAAADQIDRLTATGRMSSYTVPGADHVFSDSGARRQFITHTVDWTLALAREVA